MGKSQEAREDMGNSKQFGMGKTGHETRVTESDHRSQQPQKENFKLSKVPNSEYPKEVISLLGDSD